MATTEELVIKISADVNPLHNDVDNTKTKLRELGDEAEKTERRVNDAFDNDNTFYRKKTAINGLFSDLDNYEKSASKASNALGGIGDAANTAGDEADGASEKVKKLGDETEKTGTRSDSSLKKLIPSWKAVAVAVAGAITVIAGGSLKLIQMGADADATSAKFNTIFSGMEGSTQAWVDNFVAATGRQKYATMDVLSDIQAVTTAMGVEKEAGVGMAEALLERSTDVAAFFNAQDPEVLEAIKSGLVGEMEPLKKYGVILSEANVQQELSNMLGAEGAKVATNAEKVQARVNIIMAQTAAIQGQQSREAGSYQEQLKRLSNTLSTTFADAGKSAMESMTGVLVSVNELMGDGGLVALQSVLETVAEGVAWVVVEVVDIIRAFNEWGQSGLYDTLRNFADNTLRNLTDMLGSSYEALQEFVGRGGLERLGEAARVVIDEITTVNRILGEIGVYKAFGAVIGAIVTGLLGFAEGVAYTITEFNKFKRAIITTVADVLDAIGTIVPGADDMAAGLRRSLDSVETTAQTTSTNVSSEFAKMYNSVDATMGGFPSVIVDPLNATASPAKTSASNIGTSANSGLVIGMSGMPASASSVMGNVASSIAASGPSLASAATNAGNRAVTAIEASFARVQSVLSDVKNAFDSATYYSSRMPSSGHGGSSSSTGSTGVVSQGGRGTGESSVRIVEAHATGGIASYTGLHHLERGEVTVPPQFDWNARVVNPIVNALNSSRTGNRNVTINVNNSTDVKNLQRTITKSVQRGVNGTTMVI